MIGLSIVDVRGMTDLEREQEGWTGWASESAVIVLSDGSKLYAAKDHEGNGPGCLFGTRASGEAFCLLPDQD